MERLAYLLTRQWREGAGGTDLIFWAASDEGPVRILVTGQESVCFIPAGEIDNAARRLREETGWRHAAVALSTFALEPVEALYFRSQRAMLDARERLQRVGIEPSESDIRPPHRYLMERFVTGPLRIEGEARNEGAFLSFTNPRIAPVAFRPTMKAVSMDIETSVTSGAVLSVAVLDGSGERVFMVGDGAGGEEGIEYVPDERALISRFSDYIERSDPDLLLGWNLVNFDLTVLQERADRLGVPFSLGRDRQAVEWRGRARGNRRFATIPGRVALDGIDLLRSASYTFESFSLEFVAQTLLGRGKLLEDDEEKAAQIETLYRENRAALAEYNLEDCRLVWEIFERERLVNFVLERGRLTGLELDRPGGSVAAFDYLYLPRLHRNGYVAPATPDNTPGLSAPGGYVLDSTPGIFDDVIVLDFKSLYPSIIRTFHVDPLAMVEAMREPEEKSSIPGFEGARFSRNRFLLPSIIEELWQARDRAKQNQDSVLSYAIKIIMNSFYGVLGSPGCRFHDRRLVSSITRRGHEIIRRTKDLIEEAGYQVIYGDTDSVFVRIDRAHSTQSVDEIGGALVEMLNGWWREEVARNFGLESFLELEYETHYSKFLMPTVRGSERGSKKRYAGLIRRGEGEFELVFKGLESVRSDWTHLAREFQVELYRRIFLEEPFADYVRDVVAAVLAGERDDELVLRKRLRRNLGDYQRNVPPHVQAARSADRIRAQRGLEPRYENGGWIEYVNTTSGPEPKQYRTSPIDYQFYIDHQLAPIADAILYFKSTSLAQITDRQIGLF